MLNKPGASAITTAKPSVLWIAKMFGDDDCFLIVVAFLKALVGKSRVYSLSLSSFPKVVVQDLLFSVAVILESCSPGSVVIKQGLDSGTLRAGSLRAACSPLG